MAEKQKMYLETKTSFNLPKDLPDPFKNKNKPFNFSITSEWWQVLTILTVILSVASIFLAFNQIRPEVYRNEFLIIDQTKASVYLIAETADRQIDKNFNFVAIPDPETVCEKGFSSTLEEEDLRVKTEPILSLESDLQKLEQQNIDKINLLRQESKIQPLFSQANTDLVEKRLFIEKKFLLAENVSNILVYLNRLCNGSEESLLLTQTESALEAMNSLEGIDRQKLSNLRSRVDNWKVNHDKIDFKSGLEIEGFLEEIKEVDDFYVKVEESGQALEAQFSVLEDWQLKFTADNGELREKLVLIKNKKDGSIQ